MLSLLALLAACDRHEVLVICHNAHCTGPIDPSKDDTEAALRASLGATYEGRPTVDGVELDAFLSRPDGGECLFAHEPGTIRDPLRATEAAELLVEHFARAGDISWNGQRFYVSIELKGFVDCPSCEHTPAEVAAHADCVLEMVRILEQGAIRHDRRIQVILDSTEARLLRAVTASPDWPGKRSGEQVELELSADFSDPTSTGLIENPRLDEFEDLELGMVFLHPSWINHGVYEAFRSMDLEIVFWMFSATVENLDAIERLEPSIVVTSEADLMRRWLEY